jgi:hypothetical protein
MSKSKSGIASKIRSRASSWSFMPYPRRARARQHAGRPGVSAAMSVHAAARTCSALYVFS